MVKVPSKNSPLNLWKISASHGIYSSLKSHFVSPKTMSNRRSLLAAIVAIGLDFVVTKSESGQTWAVAALIGTRRVGRLACTPAGLGWGGELRWCPDKDSRATGAWCNLIKSGTAPLALYLWRGPARSLASMGLLRAGPGSDSHILAAAANQRPNYTAQWVPTVASPIISTIVTLPLLMCNCCCCCLWCCCCCCVFEKVIWNVLW